MTLIYSVSTEMINIFICRPFTIHHTPPTATKNSCANNRNLFLGHYLVRVCIFRAETSFIHFCAVGGKCREFSD